MPPSNGSMKCSSESPPLRHTAQSLVLSQPSDNRRPASHTYSLGATLRATGPLYPTLWNRYVPHDSR